MFDGLTDSIAPIDNRYQKITHCKDCLRVWSKHGRYTMCPGKNRDALIKQIHISFYDQNITSTDKTYDVIFGPLRLYSLGWNANFNHSLLFYAFHPLMLDQSSCLLLKRSPTIYATRNSTNLRSEAKILPSMLLEGRWHKLLTKANYPMIKDCLLTEKR